VDERRPESNDVRSARRADIDAAVGEDGVPDRKVQLIEIRLGHSGRPVAETDDVERCGREQLQVIGGVYFARDVCSDCDAALHDRAIAVASTRGKRRPYRKRTRPAGELRGAEGVPEQPLELATSVVTPSSART